ncbi:MAG: hypothetical protein GC146_00585 [Limimaricola sp.]|uniref:hypothetical protein n=1 Tax=Limimaricola sp. TaxID=2211665 RepID=UPI001D412973|nr:hypothetical protein [Limimaricola sp.]MBI1415693.1 hypothetical protein [Limimaricola sp.]
MGLTLLAGCGIDGGDLTPGGTANARIRIANISNATITSVLISRCDAMSYGFNRMPQGADIPPNYSHDFSVAAGCYDVKAGYGYVTGYADATFTDIHVPAGGTYTLGVQ